MDYENIKKLIDDVGESKLSSVEIDFPDGMRICLKKELSENRFCDVKNDNSNVLRGLENNSVVMNRDDDFHIENGKVDNNLENSSKGGNSNEEEDNYRYVTSPMVGTFYSKPSPTEKAFVDVGDCLKKGDTTCIIEAMKLMNEIETEFEGEVVEILKKDGEPVEYGEKLIKLR